VANGRADLDAQIARLRGLGKAVVRDAMPDVVDAVREELTDQIDAGRAPDGTAWPRTKAGRKALPNASDALTVTAVGTVVIARIEGHDALHDKGLARGHVVRKMLPTGKAPQPITAAIKRVVDERFVKHMGGR
jgi:hypothetical protein